MVFKIYRAGDLHNKPGIFNVGRTHFYDVIEPRLEKACLGDRAVGYTDRSVERVQAEMIAEGAAARTRKSRPLGSESRQFASAGTSTPTRPGRAPDNRASPILRQRTIRND
jgi:hypothetical protein